MGSTTDQLIGELFGDASAKPVLHSTSERVADLLRGYLTDGRIAPGTRLSDDSFAKALSVSRNTVREAFRLLGHEGLLVHELNRGVFVRQLSREDVNDIYDLRELLELYAVRRTDAHTSEALAALHETLVAGRTAAAAEDWRLVGTLNLEFHQRIVQMANSPRVGKWMRGLQAETRLAFNVMTQVEAFDSPYLTENEAIYSHLEAGRGEEAAALVLEYLTGARQQLMDAFDTLEAVSA